ncbi:CHAP domain-containing protein [Citrobacter farmeri]|uniref:CHAP domain-containing protein n=1 Tax=Citrobacter farmeri TaxID=67824 RepID=UPI001C99FC57|nr:CHAP domain-containing protein [Citrobacter farmeri]QZE47552.1 CHAP domain-containing protein [Citrobacter farmeri]
MSWNKSEAVSYARIHAQPQTTHYCARAVAAAIRAGGVKIEGANAKDFGRSLEKAGFTKVYGTPIAVDIAVINALPGPKQYGHVCIYDGAGTWYSDFKQRALYPGPVYRQLQPAVTIYRHY